MKGKLFKGILQVDKSKATVLEQRIVTDTLSNRFLLDYGGATLFKNGYVYNYNDEFTNKDNSIIKYDKNDVKFILPPDTKIDRINLIVNSLKLLPNLKNIELNLETVGFWIDKDGFIVKEYNKVIEFNTTLSDIRLEYFIDIMDNIKYEYNQETTALYINDALLLI